MMKKFIEIYNHNDLTGSIWMRHSEPLEKITINDDKKDDATRYALNNQRKITISNKSDNDFEGISYYLQQKSLNIENDFEVTSSSILDNHIPSNSISYKDKNHYFSSKDIPDSWLRFKKKIV